jgi:hypothetical protein
MFWSFDIDPPEAEGFICYLVLGICYLLDYTAALKHGQALVKDDGQKI